MRPTQSLAMAACMWPKAESLACLMAQIRTGDLDLRSDFSSRTTHSVSTQSNGHDNARPSTYTSRPYAPPPSQFSLQEP